MVCLELWLAYESRAEPMGRASAGPLWIEARWSHVR